MITACATGEHGEQIILLGLTAKNVQLLRAGRPVRVTAETHPGFPEQLRVVIVYGDTERDITQELEPLLSAATQIVVVPRNGNGTPS